MKINRKLAITIGIEMLALAIAGAASGLPAVLFGIAGALLFGFVMGARAENKLRPSAERVRAVNRSAIASAIDVAREKLVRAPSLPPQPARAPSQYQAPLSLAAQRLIASGLTPAEAAQVLRA